MPQGPIGLTGPAGRLSVVRKFTDALLRRNLPCVPETVPLTLAHRQEKTGTLSTHPPELFTLSESIRDRGRRTGHLRRRSRELSGHGDGG